RRRPLVLLDALAVDVVGIGQVQHRGRAVGRLQDVGQLVEGVVRVGRGLLAGPLGLADQVALGVEAVGVGAVAGQPVPGARLVAGHRPVAVGVVAVGRLAAVGEELVGAVVAVVARGGVGGGAHLAGVGLAGHPVGVVIGVVVIAQRGAA